MGSKSWAPQAPNPVGYTRFGRVNERYWPNQDVTLCKMIQFNYETLYDYKAACIGEDVQGYFGVWYSRFPRKAILTL